MNSDCGHILSGSYCKICGTKPEKKKPASIKKESQKRKIDNKEYSIEGKKFLALNRICLIKSKELSMICGHETSTIHHTRGRIGALLMDKRFWLPCCMDCHIIIENNPEWAKQKGYSESRLQV